MNVQSMSLGVAFVTFLGGLLSFFSPCVCPLIPGYLAYLARFTEPQALQQAGSEAPPAVDRADREAAGAGTVAALGAATAVLAVTPSGVSAFEGAHEAAPQTFPRTMQTTVRMGMRWSGVRSLSQMARTQIARFRSPAFTATALFVLGFSTAFVALGLLAASFGTLVAAYQPVMQTVVGIVMLAMGALVLGWLPTELLDPLQREFRLHLDTERLRPLGRAAPVALGMVFAAGWTPCIGPVLAALLTYVGASANLGWGATLLSVYSLGFAVPFLALGAGWSVSLRATRWITRHGLAVSRVTGAALLLLGLLYITGEITVFAIWAQRYTPSLFSR